MPCKALSLYYAVRIPREIVHTLLVFASMRKKWNDFHFLPTRFISVYTYSIAGLLSFVYSIPYVLWWFWWHCRGEKFLFSKLLHITFISYHIILYSHIHVQTLNILCYFFFLSNSGIWWLHVKCMLVTFHTLCIILKIALRCYSPYNWVKTKEKNMSHNY